MSYVPAWLSRQLLHKLQDDLAARVALEEKHRSKDVLEEKIRDAQWLLGEHDV